MSLSRGECPRPGAGRFQFPQHADTPWSAHGRPDRGRRRLVFGVSESMVGGRILIVDSDKRLALQLSYGLYQAGYQVFVAYNAECAAYVALRERPDLILLEVELPRYSGLEFHECLQYSSRARDIPVIYVTGNSSPSLLGAANNLGATACLRKPLDMRSVLSAIHSAMRTGSLSREPAGSACA